MYSMYIRMRCREELKYTILEKEKSKVFIFLGNDVNVMLI